MIQVPDRISCKTRTIVLNTYESLHTFACVVRLICAWYVTVWKIQEQHSCNDNTASEWYEPYERNRWKSKANVNFKANFICCYLLRMHNLHTYSVFFPYMQSWNVIHCHSSYGGVCCIGGMCASDRLYISVRLRFLQIKWNLLILHRCCFSIFLYSTNVTGHKSQVLINLAIQWMKFLTLTSWLILK